MWSALRKLERKQERVKTSADRVRSKETQMTLKYKGDLEGGHNGIGMRGWRGEKGKWIY